MITLVTGGTRSGKSGFAEKLAAGTGLEVVYVATARAGDDEMRERVRRHRERRPADWHTVEEPVHLAWILKQHAQKRRCIVVDCLTLWLTNLILADHADGGEVAVIEPGKTFVEERADVLETLPKLLGNIILVSNEVGTGIVPLGALNRFFVDETGRLNQAIAERADRVYWMVAGCPVLAKGV